MEYSQIPNFLKPGISFTWLPAFWRTMRFHSVAPSWPLLLLVCRGPLGMSTGKVHWWVPPLLQTKSKEGPDSSATWLTNGPKSPLNSVRPQKPLSSRTWIFSPLVTFHLPWTHPDNILVCIFLNQNSIFYYSLQGAYWFVLLLVLVLLRACLIYFSSLWDHSAALSGVQFWEHLFHVF